MSNRFEFSFIYSTRVVSITGTASVFGNYDGPSEPEAMVRAALRDKNNTLRLTWMNAPPDYRSPALPQPWPHPPLTDEQINQIFEVPMLTIKDIIGHIALGRPPTVETLLLVQVGTQLYGLTKVADDTVPRTVIYETQALANPLDQQAGSESLPPS